MKRYINSTELGQLLGCSLETIRSWRRKDGLPGVKDGRAYKFDMKLLLEWLQSCLKNDYADILFDHITKLAKPKKRKRKNLKKSKSKAKAKSQADKKNISTNDKKNIKKAKSSELTKNEITINSVDLFGQRHILSRIFSTRSLEMQAEKDPAKASRYCALLTQLADTCRKSDIACLDIDLRCKNVIPTQYAISFIGKMATSIKTEALSLPGALSEQLAAESDPKQIYKIIEEAVHSMLRHLSKTFEL